MCFNIMTLLAFRGGLYVRWLLEMILIKYFVSGLTLDSGCPSEEAWENIRRQWI